MYFFTHLLISKTLYPIFNAKVDLDKRLFAYGNIKPDLPSPDHKKHTLENYLFVVRDYSRLLITASYTKEDFSVCLGELCHYVCDFFCYYHTDDKLHGKMFHHFFYELLMHAKLHQLYLLHKSSLVSMQEEPRPDFLTIIIEMRKLYFANKRTMEKDLTYAFSTSIWICESIFNAIANKDVTPSVLYSQEYTAITKKDKSL